LARDLANNSLTKAQEDFYRNNYFYVLDEADPNFKDLEKRFGIQAIMLTIENAPEVSARYEALSQLKLKPWVDPCGNFIKNEVLYFQGL